MTLKPSSETFLFFIFYTICCVSSSENVEFPCQILDPLLFRINSTIYVPQNSSAPFAISANFTCTYPFFVQKNEYLRLSVINSLLDKDVIEFVDSVGYRRNLTVQSIANDELFATFGHGHVRIITGPQGRSRALLVFQWLEMPDSNWSEKLHKNESGQNVDCMDIQQKAITFTAVDDKERIALNIAHSGYVFDRFDSYFIFDGPDTSSPVVGRMSSHVVVPFISSNQSVTVIGLTKQVVYSNVIANIQSNIAGYRKYQAAVVIDQYGGQLDSINQTIAVTFIAKDANQLYITMLSPSSELDMLFPQQFPTSQVTVELTDCSVYMVLSKNTPANFYMVGDDERMGYVFTPSFLDGQATPDWNFTLSSNQSCHFSTTVESVTIYNEQVLAITVYNEKGYSAMSTVITGNETGGAAEGIGTSVNMNLFGSKGQGQAKIRYHISKISEQITGVSILALLALWTIW
ncbi:hypothetical protein GCK72_017776 [Caenorhabditis remanei]|uniref:CUB-like domain-containing protein n=1 Tax=Caenorhabditis remanei TaxID=31234 RepID=A0A6A5G9H9_CAERE|nr:hypothetical protein GCK72_017776 [Caenorhabditis remanei]KAF1751222.1 hypothetical protein GCK72_017776 [Caenorhabditis remanei]